MEHFDFLVIGSGSGLDVANVAVNQGESVAIVEKGPLGGTCLNRGCIPSKHLIYHAEVLETIEGADAFEIEAEVTDLEGDALGTWHVEAEWIDRLHNGDLSETDFSEMVIETIEPAAPEE